MITIRENAYRLETEHTSYVFRVTETGHLEHLYYGESLGRPLTGEDILAMTEKRITEQGNMIAYDPEHKNTELEDMRLEMSSYGKGDIREPFIEVCNPDGSFSADFLFEKAEQYEEKAEFETLPSSYSEDGKAEHLCVFLRDRHSSLLLELHYSVYPECDVICRSSRLLNQGNGKIQLDRLMSTQLDMEDSGYEITSFSGAWGREMKRTDTPSEAGKIVLSSYTGTSSNRMNPFVMIHRKDTSETCGACYGMNLIYSGNHYEALEVNAYGKTRFVSGINPQSFCFVLEPGDTFEAPEAVMSFSSAGFRMLSHQMHRFVREHIVRGVWKYKPRPILLNSWEAAYFQLDEAKLLRLAKAGKEAGMELFVMDDGWFTGRRDDTSSLGDWEADTKKLPDGVAGICRKVNALGMDFGIWVEPEMVNRNSRLYQSHPEWAMEIPGREHSEGRNQMLLDLANPDVVDFLAEQMTKLFSSANISYVKWDMNRIFSDLYSRTLPPERQKETQHRYIMGLYRLMKRLTEKFPEILFEGCASGGNRFDLGILSYFPQIWASDNTDAICRTAIQEGYSYGYPMSVLTAHVSSVPNHQTLRVTPLDTRFGVAAFGVLGYECNLCDMKKEELSRIREQIQLYKQWREVLQFGDFYRGKTGNIHEWTCVSGDRNRAVGLYLQEMAVPNSQFGKYKASGLDAGKRYHFFHEAEKQDIRQFGGLINTASPVHIRPGSVIQDVVAKFITLPGEREDICVSGNVLMHAGICLAPAFSGTGYEEGVRLFRDFSCRLYFMETVEETAEEAAEETVEEKKE